MSQLTKEGIKEEISELTDRFLQTYNAEDFEKMNLGFIRVPLAYSNGLKTWAIVEIDDNGLQTVIMQ